MKTEDSLMIIAWIQYDMITKEVLHLRALYGFLSADVDKSVWFDTKMD